MGWLLLTYRLPNEKSRARLAVWRELRRSGALHLQQSVVAVPDDPAFAPAVERLRELVAEVGGQTLAVRAEPMETADGQQLTDAWNVSRDAEYAELCSECEKFLVEIDHEFEIGKFTLAELEEEEAEIDKLRCWQTRIAGRDVHSAPAARDAQEAMQRAEEAYERYSAAVYEATKP